MDNVFTTEQILEMCEGKLFLEEKDSFIHYFDNKYAMNSVPLVVIGRSERVAAILDVNVPKKIKLNRYKAYFLDVLTINIDKLSKSIQQVKSIELPSYTENKITSITVFFREEREDLWQLSVLKID